MVRKPEGNGSRLSIIHVRHFEFHCSDWGKLNFAFCFCVFFVPHSFIKWLLIKIKGGLYNYLVYVTTHPFKMQCASKQSSYTPQRSLLWCQKQTMALKLWWIIHSYLCIHKQLREALNSLVSYWHFLTIIYVARELQVKIEQHE